MAGVSFHIAVDDLAVRAALSALADRARDLSPAMDEIGAYMVFATQRRFEQGVGPDGKPWPVSQRAAEQGGQTLVDTARLLGSLTHVYGPDFAEAGTNVIYAAIHQFGGQTGRNLSVDMPARPFLGVSDEDGAEITAILADHLMDGAGFGPGFGPGFGARA